MEAVRPVEYDEGAPSGQVAATGPQGISSLPDAVLSDITHLLVSAGSPEKVVEAVADALSELVPHDSLMLYRAEPHLRSIRPVLVRDPLYEEDDVDMGPELQVKGSICETTRHTVEKDMSRSSSAELQSHFTV